MDELDTPSILAVGARLANLARAKATGDFGLMDDGLIDDESANASENALDNAFVGAQGTAADHGRIAGPSLAEVGSAREAFELLKVVCFDLVAIGPDVSDMAPGELARQLRAARPWQKWVLVADAGLTDDDERQARSLGALAVVEGPDAWRDVWATARRVRRATPQAGVRGLRLNAATGATIDAGPNAARAHERRL